MNVYDSKMHLDCLWFMVETAKSTKKFAKKTMNKLLPSNKMLHKIEKNAGKVLELDYKLKKAKIDYELAAEAYELIKNDFEESMIDFSAFVANLAQVPKKYHNCIGVQIDRYSDEVDIYFGGRDGTPDGPNCGHYTLNLNGWFTCHKEVGEPDIISNCIESFLVIYEHPPNI